MAHYKFGVGLWGVEQTVNLANERAAGIVGQNPIEMPSDHLGCAFTLNVQTKTAITLSDVRIYGRYGGITGFPPPGTPAEALCIWAATPGVNQGFSRVPTLPSAGGDRFVIPMVPRFLLLEYTTSGAGGGAIVRFSIIMTAWGLPQTGAM